MSSTDNASSGAGPSGTKIMAKAEELYNKCAEDGPSRTWYQGDLMTLKVASSLTELAACCQKLLDDNLFELLYGENQQICYRVRKRESAQRFSALSEKDRIVYSAIHDAKRIGIWTKSLKMRTGLHQTVLNKCLKSLEGQKAIKQIKSVKYPGRKIYMLAELTPGDETTGGCWFSEGELDQDLVDIVAETVTRYVRKNSWCVGEVPQATLLEDDTNTSMEVDQPIEVRQSNSKGKKQSIPHPPGFQGYPTVTSILDFVEGMGVVQDKEIDVADMEHLLDMLVYDGRLERIGKKQVLRHSRQTKGPEEEEIEGAGEDVVMEDMYRWVRGQVEVDRENYGLGGIEERDVAILKAGAGNGYSEVPCSRCPVFRLCEEGGPVNARNCGYFGGWLAA